MLVGVSSVIAATIPAITSSAFLSASSSARYVGSRRNASVKSVTAGSIAIASPVGWIITSRPTLLLGMSGATTFHNACPAPTKLLRSSRAVESSASLAACSATRHAVGETTRPNRCNVPARSEANFWGSGASARTNWSIPSPRSNVEASSPSCQSFGALPANACRMSTATVGIASPPTRLRALASIGGN